MEQKRAGFIILVVSAIDRWWTKSSQLRMGVGRKDKVWHSSSLFWLVKKMVYLTMDW